MKKRTKTIIGLIIGLLIGISTTVGAATIFNSKDITYSSDKTTKTNVKEALDELYSKANKCPLGKWCYNEPMTIADKVELGDYISMTPTATSYTPSGELTGCLNDSNCKQNTINPSELNLWRVIKKNEDGTIDIVSEYVSSIGLYFYGKTGYINYIKGLNTIASQYTDGIHVLKTRHMGYSDQTEVIADTSFLDKTSKPWPLDGSLNLSASCDESVVMCNQYESYGGGDTKAFEDYNLVKQALGSAQTKTPSGTDYVTYYIAGRLYNSGFFCESCWDFRGRRVKEDGSTASQHNYRYDTTTNSFISDRHARSVRPIITLKSTISISSGSGEQSSPYKLL